VTALKTPEVPRYSNLELEQRSAKTAHMIRHLPEHSGYYQSSARRSSGGLTLEPTTMAKTSPWHSSRNSDRKVYHDNTSCTEGNNIETRYRTAGTGGRPRCEHCNRLG